MTGKEALERANNRDYLNSLGIPEMDKKEVQRLMAKPSVTFIRHKRSTKDVVIPPTSPKSQENHSEKKSDEQ